MTWTSWAMLAVGLLLSACGGGTSHPICKDEASKDAYMQKFTQDAIDATTSGKIDDSKAQALNDDLSDAMKTVPATDWGAACTKADDLRKKYGL